jgi:hypothetical protein
VGHRVAVYTVRVHKFFKPDVSRLLGDIDERGSRLISALDKYMVVFESVSADESKVVQGLSSAIEGDELHLMLQHGQRGVVADIVDPTGELRIHQEADDTQRVRCGCLLQLPPAETDGWLAVHINNGRAAKGLLAKGVTARFREEFPELVLGFAPYVMGSVLREAVDHDRVEKVTLVKLERPNDRSNAATDKWVRSAMSARVELGIQARGRQRRLLPDLLRRFLGGDANAFGEIVAFEGLTFDEAKVQVELENGSSRTFNIERPDVGHAFTEDLDGLETQADGEPTEVSLFAALRGALPTVGP